MYLVLIAFELSCTRNYDKRTTATGMKRSTIKPQDKGNILLSNHPKVTQPQGTICQGHPKR